MSLLGRIFGKIFHHGSAVPAPPSKPARAAPPAAVPRPGPAAPAPVAPPPAAPVDVDAVLTAMAAVKPGGGGNWRTSIADLLRLLDLDNSLAARRELPIELGVRAGEDGSAAQNIALHKAVMRALSENGGIVPASMRD